MVKSTETTDSNWVRRAFSFVKGTYKNPYTNKTDTRVTYTSAGEKYTNASLGGSFAINVPYQFCRWTDIRHAPRGGGDPMDGMGSYYSDAIDNNGLDVHMTFGATEFNSLASFFFNFYDAKTAVLVNYGKVNSFFYNTGDVLGFVFTLPLQPFILGAKWAMNVINFFKDTGSSKFAYFRPTMHTYWMAVNNMANELAVNMGIIPRIASGTFNTTETTGGLTPYEMSNLAHMWMPQLFRSGKTGGIDMMNVSRAAQRRAAVDKERMMRAREAANTQKGVADATLRVLATKPPDPRPGASTADLFKAYTDKMAGTPDAPVAAVGNAYKDRWTELQQNARSHMEDGSQFVTFRVANTNQSLTDSFSNSFEESGVSQQINGKVKQVRDQRFNFADGNILPMLDEAKKALASFAAGALDEVGLGGLLSLAGEAYVDIPLKWADATASLPSISYTIPLYTAYGNPLSRFFDIAVPMSHILPACVPRSTGRASYTSPFFCQVYQKGRIQCRYGMIESAVFRRGGGNIGWNNNGEMLAGEIEITVKDLSGILSAPIVNYYESRGIVKWALNTGLSAASQALTGNTALAKILDGHAFDESSNFQSYMAVLGSVDIGDSFYRMRKLKMNLTRENQAFINETSMSTWSSYLLDTPTARMMSGLLFDESGRFQ